MAAIADGLVMVLGGRRTAETLKQLGYRVGIVSASIPFDLTVLADVPVEVDLEDPELVVEELLRVQRHHPIAAVVTQMESLVPLAGRLRERLGLETGVSEEAAANCRDKARTRERLAAAGVPSARFRVVASAQEAVAAASEIGLPVMLKPRDASSGALLMLCRDAGEVAAAAEAVFASGRDSALVEEFLVGDELVLFVYRSRGRMDVVSLLDVDVGPPPKFVKLGARHPSRIDAEQAAAVRDVAERCLAALGLDNWVATVQVMLTADGPRIIEVNPRVPGGQTVELIAETCGMDPTQVAVEAALGKEPTRYPAAVPMAWYRCLTFEQAGRLHYRPEAEDGPIAGLESPLAPVIEMDVAPGEMVLPINHPRGGVFGRLVLFGEDEERLARDHRRVLDALDLRLEPVDEAELETAWRPHTKCC